MNLRVEAARKLTEIELGKIEYEFNRIWHNGSIEFPDIETDEEWEIFWNSLSDVIPMWIEDIENEIKEQFDIDWTIYQTGRSGATFYPDQYERYIKHGDEITVEDIYGLDPDAEYWDSSNANDEWPEAYKIVKNFADALKYLNDTVRADANGVPEWWKNEKEYKEAA